MDLLRVGGDALWVISMALMAGASRQALARTPGAAKLRAGGLRLGRWATFCALPVVGFAVSLGLAYAARSPDLGADARVMLFGLRALLAALFALLHLRWVGRALSVLGRQGQLSP